MRTEDENTIRAAIPFAGDAKTSLRRATAKKVPRTTRNGTSLKTEYFDYITTINVGKCKNASGNGCTRKDYIIIMT